MAAKAGHYDAVVIGAGSGGLTAARTAARFGARTLLVERLPRLGGDCTWYGCVPSKALIRCAHAMHEARHGARFGVAGLNAESLTCDWQKVKNHVKSCQEHIYNQDDSPEILEAAGVEVRLGVHASFVDAKTLQLATVENTTPGGTELVTANHFIIATGAGPVIPPLKGLEAVKYATYETIFDLPEFPSSLAVIGGGPIGSELAQAFARLGCKVTLVGKMMPREDDDVRHVMSQVFEKDGIVVVEGRAESVEPTAGGIVLRAGGRSLTCAGLLLAAGRRPKGLDAMSLDRAGVKWTQNGISVDAKLRTSAKHIYAVGDCLGGLQFTHLAGYQGALAAFNAVQPISLAGPGNPAVPRCTFTHPEVATVGLTMKEAADAHGIDKVSAKMRMLSHVDRAVCEGETEGFIKIIVGSGGEILGATVVAPAAGDVAQELGLAVAQRLTLRSVSTCIHSYPAMSFAIQQMAADHVYESLEKSSALSCLRCLCGPKLSGIKPSSSSDESS